MTELTNRHWVLSRTPDGPLSPDVFAWGEAPVAPPGPGQVLVRNRMLSVDPAQRAWMKGRTYREQVMPGDVMHAFGLGEVVASQSPGFAPGDIVEGMLGWQDYAVAPAEELTRRDSSQSLDHLIGVLSITGLTAYHGLFDVAQVRAGDTVLVSAAAGAVGTVAGQIAKKPDAARLVWPAAKRNAAGWSRRSATTPPSTTRPATCAVRSAPPARTASTSISTTSAGKCWTRRCCR